MLLSQRLSADSLLTPRYWRTVLGMMLSAPTPLILQRFAREAGREKPAIAPPLPVSPSIFSQNQRDLDFFGSL